MLKTNYEALKEYFLLKNKGYWRVAAIAKLDNSKIKKRFRTNYLKSYIAIRDKKIQQHPFFKIINENQKKVKKLRNNINVNKTRNYNELSKKVFMTDFEKNRGLTISRNTSIKQGLVVNKIKLFPFSTKYIRKRNETEKMFNIKSIQNELERQFDIIFKTHKDILLPEDTYVRSSSHRNKKVESINNNNNRRDNINFNNNDAFKTNEVNDYSNIKLKESDEINLNEKAFIHCEKKNVYSSSKKPNITKYLFESKQKKSIKSKKNNFKICTPEKVGEFTKKINKKLQIINSSKSETIISFSNSVNNCDSPTKKIKLMKKGLFLHKYSKNSKAKINIKEISKIIKIKKINWDIDNNYLNSFRRYIHLKGKCNNLNNYVNSESNSGECFDLESYNFTLSPSLKKKKNYFENFKGFPSKTRTIFHNKKIINIFKESSKRKNLINIKYPKTTGSIIRDDYLIKSKHFISNNFNLNQKFKKIKGYKYNDFNLRKIKINKEKGLSPNIGYKKVYNYEVKSYKDKVIKLHLF